MTMRAAILLATGLVSFTLMTAVGAVLTEGKAQGPLSLGDVIYPAVIPVLLVITATVACRRQLRRRGREDQNHG